MSTASSVASTTPANSGLRSRPCTAATVGTSSRGTRSPVANAKKISPLPWVATEPVRANPSPARRASRWQPAGSTGASVATTTMHDPAGGGTGVVGGGSGSRRPTGTPSTVSRACSPKFVITRTPTVWPAPVTRHAVPMPPLKPRQLIPVPDPTAPSAGRPPRRAAASASATSSRVTCMRRESLSQLSSHSATIGMMTSSSPIAGSSAMSSSQAASYTRPTCIVLVRNSGVSTRPHSCAVRKPVHSPAPLRTAPPAGTGSRKPLPPGSTTVTPVRATPRPCGGSGSSRHTVAWPTPTPATSTIEPVGPLGSVPILIPNSAARGISGA